MRLISERIGIIQASTFKLREKREERGQLQTISAPISQQLKTFYHYLKAN